MSAAAEFAQAAAALVGAPFRLRGSDPATGLDCVGLVHAALAASGQASPVLPHYALRNLDVSRLARLLPQAGFGAAEGDPAPGDLLLLKPSAAQFHLAVVGPDGLLIHAHGGLRRVVASPAPLPWPQVGHWRLLPR